MLYRGVTLGLVVFALACGCGSDRSQGPCIVVYTSVDQVHAGPVLEAFESETGIRVLAVYDVEAAKTTGLVNRLVAEAGRPQADVFWSGEFVQTMLLKEKGVLAAYDSPAARDIPSGFRDPERFWTGFAGRARVFIVNTRLMSTQEYPKTVEELADPTWSPTKSAVAMPLFGTTVTHAAALYASWGPARARAFFEKLRDSGVRIVDGNSVVRDMVADGRVMLGLTDTDDAAGAVARGAPVAVVYPDQGEVQMGTLLIPNTVALIRGGSNPDEGRKLIDYLLSRDVEKRLVEAGWCHVPVRELDVRPKHLPPGPVKTMSLDLEDVYEHLEAARRDLTEVFVR